MKIRFCFQYIQSIQIKLELGISVVNWYIYIPNFKILV